jgi:hypothetical protein
MGAAVEEARNNIRTTAKKLFQEIKGNIRIGVIAHGDYCDYPRHLDTMDLTDNEDKLIDFINKVKSTGGGDTDENYEQVLEYVSNEISWTPGSRRSLVMIGDCEPHPPHVAESQMKSYKVPNPHKIDWREEADSLWNKGIKVYAVQAHNNRKLFYQKMAARTCGVYVTLSSFNVVTEMIIAICLKEFSVEKFNEYYQEVLKQGKMDQDTKNMFQQIEKGGVELTMDEGKLGPLKPVISKYETIDCLIWWHHELSSKDINQEIVDRLVNGQEPSFSFGKLMERLLYFKEKGYPKIVKALMPCADKKMKSFNCPIDGKVLVLGDASSSMQVAIRTSTIISSILACLTDADLRFFNDLSFKPAKLPTTVEDIIETSQTIRARGGTLPSVSMGEVIKNREFVDAIVVISDEEENTGTKHGSFANKFVEYRNMINPKVQLVFISFLDSNEIGQMVRELYALDIHPTLFRLNPIRPDLTRVDSFLATMSSNTKLFEKNVQNAMANLPKFPAKSSKTEI